jgi:hypothetical protein
VLVRAAEGLSHFFGTVSYVPSEEEENVDNTDVSGAPGGTRTPGLLVRSQSLYPAELRAHRLIVSS